MRRNRGGDVRESLVKLSETRLGWASPTTTASVRCPPPLPLFSPRPRFISLSLHSSISPARFSNPPARIIDAPTQKSLSHRETHFHPGGGVDGTVFSTTRMRRLEAKWRKEEKRNTQCYWRGKRDDDEEKEVRDKKKRQHVRLFSTLEHTEHPAVASLLLWNDFSVAKE